MRRAWMILGLASLALLPQPQAFAWNDTGHMTVALIAYRSFSKAEKEKLQAILKGHPHYDLFLWPDKDKIDAILTDHPEYKFFLKADRPSGVDEAEWAFIRAATWPDWVRPPKGHGQVKPEWVTKYHEGPWHYINKAYLWPDKSSTVPKDNLKVPTPNVVTQIPENLNGIKAASAEDKAVALCWVLHLVGDIHQPLHCATMFSDDYKEGDRGGNSLAVRPRTAPVNLHAFWDDLLGKGTDFNTIDHLARNITAASQHDPARLPEISRDRNRNASPFDDWAEEALKDAISFAYLDGKLDFADWNAFLDHKISKDDVPDLPTGYEANAQSVARKRIALAGIRLASLLSEALK